MLAVAAGALTIGVGQASLALDLDLGLVDLSLGEDAAVSVTVGGEERSVSAAIGQTSGGVAHVSAGGPNNEVDVEFLVGDDQLLTIDWNDESIFAGLYLGPNGLDLEALGLGVEGLIPPADSSGSGVDGGIFLSPNDGQWPGVPGWPGPADVARVLAQFNPGEQQLLISRCLTILGAPPRYERNLVDLCLILAQLNAP
jgi:hypothetical protein